MSKEAAHAFRDAIDKDSALQKKLDGVRSAEELTVLGSEAGFDFTTEECAGVLAEIFSGTLELNSFELELVAGGLTSLPTFSGDVKGTVVEESKFNGLTGHQVLGPIGLENFNTTSTQSGSDT